MISLKLNDMLYKNPTMDLSYLISFSNSDKANPKTGLFILFSSIKIPCCFSEIARAKVGFTC